MYELEKAVHHKFIFSCPLPESSMSRSNISSIQYKWCAGLEVKLQYMYEIREQCKSAKLKENIRVVVMNDDIADRLF